MKGWLDKFGPGGTKGSGKPVSLNTKVAPTPSDQPSYKSLIKDPSLPTTTTVDRVENAVYRYLGHPEWKAKKQAKNPDFWDPKTHKMEEEDPTDNIRHMATGSGVAQALKARYQLATGDPYLGGFVGQIGANLLGFVHEASTAPTDIMDGRPVKETLVEAAEDLYNNNVGAREGAYGKTYGNNYMDSLNKAMYFQNLSWDNQVPDGYGAEQPFSDNNRTDPYKKKVQQSVDEFKYGGKVGWLDSYGDGGEGGDPPKKGFKRVEPDKGNLTSDINIPQTNQEMNITGDLKQSPYHIVEKEYATPIELQPKDREYNIPNMEYAMPQKITTPVISKKESASEYPSDIMELRKGFLNDPNWEDFEGNYSIFSKEDSNFYIFNNKHELIDKSVAGRGAEVGDYANTAGSFNDDVDKRGSTTPAGRYAINDIDDGEESMRDYSTPFYSFMNNKTNPDKFGPSKPNMLQRIGFHGRYNKDAEVRDAVINDDTKVDKLISYGCVNNPQKFMLKNKYNFNVGDSVFVTPEPLRLQKYIKKTR